MRHSVSACLLLLAASLALACGSPSGPHLIQSLTLSPASADAQNYPAGKVAFVPTGHYDTAPLTITPIQASWGAESEIMSNGSITYGDANGAVSVDVNGIAQCATGGCIGNIRSCSVGNTGSEPEGYVSVRQQYRLEPGCNVVQGIAQLTCP